MPLSISHPIVALIAFDGSPNGLEGLSCRGHRSHFIHPSPRAGFKQPQSLVVWSVDDTSNTNEIHLQFANHFAGKSDALYLGLYENRRTYPIKEDSPNAAGLMVGLTSAASLPQEDAFNDWYDTTHAADALKSGFFFGASRYNRLYPADKSPRYLALYQSQDPGPQALKKLLNHYQTHPSPLSPLCRIHHVWTFNSCPEEG